MTVSTVVQSENGNISEIESQINAQSSEDDFESDEESQVFQDKSLGNNKKKTAGQKTKKINLSRKVL